MGSRQPAEVFLIIIIIIIIIIITIIIIIITMLKNKSLGLHPLINSNLTSSDRTAACLGARGQSLGTHVAVVTAAPVSPEDGGEGGAGSKFIC